MGYNSFATAEDDNCYFVGSFDNVGKAGKITLGQIKPDENWDCGMGDTIATLSSIGLQETYYTYDGGDWYECDAFGTTTGDPVNDVELDVNIGLIAYSFGGSQLVFSGAVAAGDCEMNVVEDDNAFTGNFTPARLMIGDIVPSDDWDCGMGDTIATISSIGLQETYYTYENGDWYECDAFGTTTGDPVNETVFFEPNTALYTYSFAGASLSFPSPIK